MTSDLSSPERRQRRQVVVVGGGAIGLSSAYHLARTGIEVTILDRGEFGAGASWGNAGWVVPSLVHPFNAPGAVPQALRAMLHRNSPIAMRQLPTPGLAIWGLQFARASSTRRSEASLRALAALASTAITDMQHLADQLGFECRRDGLLVAFQSRAAMDTYQQSHRHIEALGYTGLVDQLDAEQTRIREPALGPDIRGALHFLDEMSIRPGSFTAALAAGIRAYGGETAAHEAVTDIRNDDRSRWTVVTDRRTIDTDAVVVAAGEHSGRLLRPLGVRLPLHSGRGCSVTLRAGQLSLKQPLKIAEQRVACTPFANGDVRISGAFDLVTLDASTAAGRMRSVLSAATPYLPALAGVDVDPAAIWSGARPCVPDSVPVVGPAGRHHGLFVATGHGTLGITLAPETGRRISEMVRVSLKTTAAQGEKT